MLSIDEILDIAVARVKRNLKEKERPYKKYIKRCKNRENLYKKKRM